MELQILLYIVLLVFCLLLSAFFSSSETSLMSLNKYRLRYFTKKGRKNARLLHSTVKKPDKLLGAILLGNNFVNIAASSLAAAIGIHYLGEKGILYSTVLMTCIVLIFCEIMPKTYASQNSMKTSFAVIRPVAFFMRVLAPFIKVIVAVSNFLLRLLGVKKATLRPSLTEDEIKVLISIGGEEGVVDKKVTEMVQNVFRIKSIFVREVMIPRGEICALEVSSGFKETVMLISKARFSRIPVYQKDLDDIIGVVHTKDIIKYISKPEKFDLRKLMSKPFFVPDSAKIGKLIQTFQRKRLHLAIIVDEYGGVEGIVTLEDILEEIVGDILDEYDEVNVMIKKIKDNVYIVDGGLQIKELNSKLSLNLPFDIDNTIAGFLLTVAGHIPKEKEVITYEGLKFQVQRRIKRKIKKIKIELPEPAQAPPASTD